MIAKCVEGYFLMYFTLLNYEFLESKNTAFLKSEAKFVGGLKIGVELTFA